MAAGPGTAVAECGMPGAGFRPPPAGGPAAMPPLSRRRNRPHLTDTPDRPAEAAADLQHHVADEAAARPAAEAMPEAPGAEEPVTERVPSGEDAEAPGAGREVEAADDLEESEELE